MQTVTQTNVAPSVGFVTMPNHPTSALAQGSFGSCNACAIGLKTADDQKEHYRSEWHRHNLKRRVANLPRISQDEFEARVSALATQAAASAVPQAFDCEACRKSFHSERAFEQHTMSHKHRERVVAQMAEAGELPQQQQDGDHDELVQIPGVPEGMTEAELEAEMERRMELCEKRPNTTCLFCNMPHPNLRKNLHHMASKHGLFLPDAKFLVDLEGLVAYLKEKIVVGYVCLWCNSTGKTFHSVEAVQGHMLDKSHCRIAYESEVDWDEFADFYDYTSAHSSKDESGSDSGDDDDDDDSNGWEEVAPEDMDDADRKILKAGDPNKKIKPRPKQIDDTIFQFVLPSGKKLIHRELQSISKQKLKPVDNRVAIQRSLIECYQNMEVSKALVPLSVQELRRQKIIRRSETGQMRQQARWQARVAVSNNNVSLKRFVNATLLWT